MKLELRGGAIYDSLRKEGGTETVRLVTYGGGAEDDQKCRYVIFGRPQSRFLIVHYFDSGRR